jgi:hypothetical protein
LSANCRPRKSLALPAEKGMMMRIGRVGKFSAEGAVCPWAPTVNVPENSSSKAEARIQVSSRICVDVAADIELHL